jgi:hypothetical protein
MTPKPDCNIGSNVGLSARIVRLRAMMGGRVVSWNDVNEGALHRVRHLLTDDSREALDQFTRARRAPSLLKIFHLQRAGVYRQNSIETLGIYLGALAGRI